MIVGFAPGGPTDVIARIVADKLSASLGKQFYVVNQPGAGGNTATGMAATSAADGYTLLVVSTGFVVNPSLFAKVPYDPVKDFAPITIVAVSPNVLTVHPSVPAKTLKELVELIRANPGKYSFAAPGVGSTPHLSGEIFRVSNRDGDHSVSLSTQVRKRFGEALALYMSYAYSQAHDRMSLVNLPARANFSNTPLDGTLDDRRLRASFFETPHKVAVAATLNLPYRLQFSLLYQGASQPPYTYVIDGDANADRIGGAGSLLNDIVYVPRNSGDITLQMKDGSAATPAEYARLEAFIEQQPCLSEQRGRIMERGRCENGWLASLNARLTTTVPLGGGQHLEITADVFNLPNLITSRWGQYRDATTGPSVPLLKLVGWDTANGRGVYKLELPRRGVVEDLASRWRIQLGARYAF